MASEHIDHAAESESAIIRLRAMSPSGGEGEHRALQAIAQTEATLALVEQQPITNKLTVALVDQLTEMARTMPSQGYPVDSAILVRDYLDADEWEGLGL